MKTSKELITYLSKQMRRNGTLLFILILSLPATGQKKIPFAKGIENKKEINVSEVASEIKYVSLETTPDCLLKEDIFDVTLVGDYLFVCDYFNLYQFTSEGKFIRKIGKAGQGPGEYTESMLGVCYDEVKKEAFLSDPRQGKVHVYSFDGQFLRDIKVNEGPYIQQRDEAGHLYGISNLFLYDKEKKGKELIVYDEKGKELYNLRFRPEDGVRYPGLLLSLAVIYPYNGSYYYKNPLETTIYQLNGKKRKPVYEMDLSNYKKLINEDDGKLVIDKEKNIGTNLPNEAAEKKIYFNNMFETDRNIGICYAQEGERRLAWYDKVSGSIYRVRSPKADTDGFIDDIQGGFPIYPRFVRNGKMISIFPATVFLEKIKATNAQGNLKKIISDLKEDDNQVVLIATLKN